MVAPINLSKIKESRYLLMAVWETPALVFHRSPRPTAGVPVTISLRASCLDRRLHRFTTIFFGSFVKKLKIIKRQ